MARVTHGYGPLIPDSYRERLTDRRLRELLKRYSAIDLCGIVGCGKTSSALALSQSITDAESDELQPLISSDLRLAFAGVRPHVIDECGGMPEVWKEAARRSSVAPDAPGSFILTRSGPISEKLRGAHSPAGCFYLNPQEVASASERLGRLHMRPLTLAEKGVSNASVSLHDLFEGRFSPTPSRRSLEEVARAICRGGWLDAHGIPTARVQRRILDTVTHYIEGCSESERQSSTALELLSAFATMTGQVPAFSEVDRILAASSCSISRNTVRTYLSAFRRAFLIEDVEGWEAPIRSKSRLRRKPRLQFADPSIPTALLGLTPPSLLQESEGFRRLFWNLCFRDLKTYAVATCPDNDLPHVCYYQDADGLSVDAVIEQPDGRWAGISFALGDREAEQRTARLLRLEKKVLASGLGAPATFLAVITAAPVAPRKDAETGVLFLPLTCLTA